MPKSTSSAITRLHKLKDSNGQPYLDKAACKAAIKLEYDFIQAGLVSGLTSNWERMDAIKSRSRRSGNRQAVLSDAPPRCARQISRRPSQALPSEYSGLLVDICCFHQSLSDVETANQWPRRSAKLVLKLGLLQLARHYGLTTDTGKTASHGQTYRPPAPLGQPRLSA